LIQIVRWWWGDVEGRMMLFVLEGGYGPEGW
jgi:hypothetical protein